MKQPGQQVGTIVGSSVHLTGAIKDSSDITIFGSVEGEVISEERIIIEDTARVKGPITAKEIIISGYVNGTVIAKERLELNASGTIKGNIDTKDLLIHSGSTFIGKSQMPEKKDDQGFTPEEDMKVDVELDLEDKEEESEEEKTQN